MDGGKRGSEQSGRPSAAGRVIVGGGVVSECPKRPAMAILRARRFQPATVVAHEVAEAAGVRVPRMLNEGRKTRRDSVGQLRLAVAEQRSRQEQSAGIVVDAVAVGS